MYRCAIVLAAILSLAAPSAAEPRPLTPTVSAAGLDLRLDDVIIKIKPDYVYLLWDAYPYRDQVDAAAKKGSLTLDALRSRVVETLAKVLPSVAGSHLSTLKADVVEFKERDEYGAPRWSSLHKLQHLELKLPVPPPAGSAPAQARK